MPLHPNFGGHYIHHTSNRLLTCIRSLRSMSASHCHGNIVISDPLDVPHASMWWQVRTDLSLAIIAVIIGLSIIVHK
jgi:hypothetical protein